MCQDICIFTTALCSEYNLYSKFYIRALSLSLCACVLLCVNKVYTQALEASLWQDIYYHMSDTKACHLSTSNEHKETKSNWKSKYHGVGWCGVVRSPEAVAYSKDQQGPVQQQKWVQKGQSILKITLAQLCNDKSVFIS